jgi:molecular chaperone DnaJ
MASKDYYRILNILPSASPEEIKKAFRKLAQQFHPDKNSGDRISAEKFSEIHEAYRILSDIKKRAEYNYIRYTENPKRTSQPVVNEPEDILQLSSKLAKETSLADPYRIDRDLLYFQLMDILSVDHLAILQAADQATINRKIIEQLIASSRFLPLNMLEDIIQKLRQIAGTDKEAENNVKEFISQAKQLYYWNRYKVYIALAIAALACLLILLSGNN